MKAPSLFNPRLGTVHIWSKDGVVPKVLADLIDGNVTQVAHRHSGELGAASTDDARRALAWEGTGAPWGRYYVTAGSERVAATVSAHLVGARHGVTCLPTKRSPGAGQWLREQIARRVDAGLDVLIVVRGGAW